MDYFSNIISTILLGIALTSLFFLIVSPIKKTASIIHLLVLIVLNIWYLPLFLIECVHWKKANKENDACFLFELWSTFVFTLVLLSDLIFFLVYFRRRLELYDKKMEHKNKQIFVNLPKTSE